MPLLCTTLTEGSTKAWVSVLNGEKVRRPFLGIELVQNGHT